MNFSIITLPLLMKELIELAAQKRTYLLRAGYALMLFAAFAVYFYYQFIANEVSRLGVFGIGEQIFQFLLTAQMIGITLFMPAIMAPAITQEKETDSLLLLMLTDLKPWEILLQKYLGRMLPMISFLLLSLPVIGFSYAYGGVSQAVLIMGVTMLFSSSFFIGALSLMFSAFCQTTVWSFVLSYVTIAVFVLPCYSLIPVLGIMITEGDGGNQTASVILYTFVSNAVTLTLTLVFLILARVFLVARATASPMEQMERTAERIQKAKKEASIAEKTGRRTDLLPGDQPVTWREMKTGWMNKRVLLISSACVAGVGTLIVWFPPFVDQSMDAMMTAGSVVAPALVILLMCLGFLSLSVLASSLIGREIGNQTLDVLLATPMTGKEIMYQKMATIRWFAMAIIFPLLVIQASEFLIDLFVNLDVMGASMGALSSLLYGINSLLLVVIYLPLVYWFCMWLGFKISAKGRAPMISILILITWIIVPYVVVFSLDLFKVLESGSRWAQLINMASPLHMIMMNEYGLVHWMYDTKDGGLAMVEPLGVILWQVGPIIINTLLYGGLLLLFRSLCIYKADQNLGRVWEGAGLTGQTVPDTGTKMEAAA